MCWLGYKTGSVWGGIVEKEIVAPPECESSKYILDDTIFHGVEGSLLFCYLNGIVAEFLNSKHIYNRERHKKTPKAYCKHDRH